MPDERENSFSGWSIIKPDAASPFSTLDLQHGGPGHQGRLCPSGAVHKYDALYEAALCRERADWIVGINATRLFSCLYHQTLNVGRVMTPTLAMVVLRDAEIAAFQPQPFYTVQLAVGGITAVSKRFE